MLDSISMGEPIAVIEKTSNREGYIRYETNRTFTGMGHESYVKDAPIYKDRPVDVLAAALLETGQVAEVHVYAQTISVQIASGASPKGLKELIENFYIYYKPGVAVPTEESFS